MNYLTFGLRKVSQDVDAKLSGEITIEENMDCGKAPGIDGLPA